MDKKTLRDLNFKNKYGIWPDTIKTVLGFIIVAVLVFLIVAGFYFAI